MRKKVVCICCLVLFHYGPVAAQSPYQMRRATDLALFGSGLATSFAAILLDTGVKPLTVEEIEALDPNDVNGFDRPAIENYSESLALTSDGVLAASLLSPVALLLGSQRVRSDFGVVSVMYFQTLMLTNATTLIAKGAAQRTRPYVYNPDVPLQKKITATARKSFFSGHASNAFASGVFFAVVYSDYFPRSKWKPVVWVGSLSAASVVSVLRVQSGKHFPTDVLVGAGVGGAIGFLVPYLHRTRKGGGVSVLPLFQSGASGVALTCRF